MNKTCLLITTYNRTPLLLRSLDRLKDLTIPDEILIVDDGGNDRCEEISSSFPTLPIDYLFVDNPGSTMPCRARNVALAHTQADVIIVSDPEVVFVSDVVQQFMYLHTQHPNHVLMPGSFYFADKVYGTELDKELKDFTHTHRSDRGGYLMGEYGKAGIGGALALYRRKWLLDVGGWDEGFPGPWGPDDIDLLGRLQSAGYNHLLPSEVEVIHQWHWPRRNHQTAKLNWDYLDQKRS